jgi:hypothetical protein
MKAYPPDDGRFVKRQTSVKDWPVFSDQAGLGPESDGSRGRQIPDRDAYDRSRQQGFLRSALSDPCTAAIPGLFMSQRN